MFTKKQKRQIIFLSAIFIICNFLLILVAINSGMSKVQGTIFVLTYFVAISLILVPPIFLGIYKPYKRKIDEELKKPQDYKLLSDKFLKKYVRNLIIESEDVTVLIAKMHRRLSYDRGLRIDRETIKSGDKIALKFFNSKGKMLKVETIKP